MRVGRTFLSARFAISAARYIGHTCGDTVMERKPCLPGGGVSTLGDGRRDAADAKLFNNKMGLGRSDAEYDRRMDMNRDGIINMADMVILTRHIERDAVRRGRSGSDGGGG